MSEDTEFVKTFKAIVIRHPNGTNLYVTSSGTPLMFEIDGMTVPSLKDKVDELRRNGIEAREVAVIVREDKGYPHK